MFVGSNLSSVLGCFDAMATGSTAGPSNAGEIGTDEGDGEIGGSRATSGVGSPVKESQFGFGAESVLSKISELIHARPSPMLPQFQGSEVENECDEIWINLAFRRLSNASSLGMSEGQAATIDGHLEEEEEEVYVNEWIKEYQEWLVINLGSRGFLRVRQSRTGFGL
ncbi:hypothetical protein B0H19DRAFT_1242953 [Mycena capillaripes]|nr:hypothetical protein B0H19DRAFT_1242953 [Mycena capillaripes]